VKIYEAHLFDKGMNDRMAIRWFKNVHYAIHQLNEDAGRYVEWKQMGEYHWAGLMSANPDDDFYIIYIREVE
jgi:hypothetical protein